MVFLTIKYKKSRVSEKEVEMFSVKLSLFSWFIPALSVQALYNYLGPNNWFHNSMNTVIKFIESVIGYNFLGLRSDIYLFYFKDTHWYLLDVIITVFLFILVIEMLRASNSNDKAITNHITSVFTMLTALFFLAACYKYVDPKIAYYFFIYTLVDTVAGLVITIKTSRKDLTLG